MRQLRWHEKLRRRKARAGRAFIFPTPLFLSAPPERLGFRRAKRAINFAQRNFAQSLRFPTKVYLQRDSPRSGLHFSSGKAESPHTPLSPRPCFGRRQNLYFAFAKCAVGVCVALVSTLQRADDNKNFSEILKSFLVYIFSLKEH